MIGDEKYPTGYFSASRPHKRANINAESESPVHVFLLKELSIMDLFFKAHCQ